METRTKTKLTDHIGFHMLLAVTGGFMDAYSYIDRGNVFATGQTGNFVLAAIRFLSKDYRGMGRAFVPITAFFAGVFLARHLYYEIFKGEHTSWLSGILFMEIAVLFLVGFIPNTVSHLFANSMVSFSAAILFCTFRNFGGNFAYSPTFCTGNMRSCAEMYYEGFVRKNEDCRIRAYHYTRILLSFFSGALVGGELSIYLQEKAIWMVCVLMMISLIIVHIEKNGKLMNSF